MSEFSRGKHVALLLEGRLDQFRAGQAAWNSDRSIEHSSMQRCIAAVEGTAAT